jgi:hypothetical protein
MAYKGITVDNDLGPGLESIDFCVVAVKDGASIGALWANGTTENGDVILMIPGWALLSSFFDSGVLLVKHAPVPDGTPWDGEKFILPDLSNFEEIGTI